jgi:hypothetical protein
MRETQGCERSQRTMAAAVGMAILAASALAVSGCSSGSGQAAEPVLTSLDVTQAPSIVELGLEPELVATGKYSDGSARDLTSTVTWTSSDVQTATVTAGVVTTLKEGRATIQAALSGITGSTVFTVGPPGHYLLGTRGIYTQFEQRGNPVGYWPGQAIQELERFDPVVGSTVAQEIALQMDAMAAMGVNAITYELRTASPGNTAAFVPPDCKLPEVLGLQYPQPTATELVNLALFLDLARAKGIKVMLRLANNHMEEQPPDKARMWLGAILGAVGGHPAIDLILFEGTQAVNGGSCAIPAEPPLWEGPRASAAKYVAWAIGYGLSLGLPARKLSAQAIIGYYASDSQSLSGPDPKPGELWSPIVVLKSIFDGLLIPAAERTYAVSFYEHPKCLEAPPSCADLSPHAWADATLDFVNRVVGSGPRVVAVEMGYLPPMRPGWSTAQIVESLIYLMHAHGIDGGSFWIWSSDEVDPTWPDSVKQRGVAFNYNPVQREIVDMGGFHLPLVPNGSFEGGVSSSGMPDRWTVGGTGTATRYALSSEPGQPAVPTRGSNSLRLVTGAAGADSVMATSAPIPVVPSTTFTTTANLRFGWTGDDSPGGTPSSRPQVSLSILYLKANGEPSTIRPRDTFAWFQEDGTTAFGTFPVVYATPADAVRVQLQFAAARNGLATPITFDIDNVR